MFFLRSNNFFFNIYILLFIVLIFIKIFIFYDHLYPLHDEIISIDRYLEPKNFLRRDSTNNQMVLSFFGMIINTIFGFNLVLLRIISFFAFIGLVFVFKKNFRNFFILNFLFVIILSSDLLFNYIYLYRGYYISSFIVVLNLFFLKEYFNKQKLKYLKYSLVSSTLLCINSIYSIYFLVPIFFTLLTFLIINKKLEFIKIIFNYFFAPCVLIYSIIIIVTGFAQTFSGNLNLSFLMNNFFEVLVKSFVPGVKLIFFQSAVLDLKFSLDAVWEKMIKGEGSTSHQITILFVISLTILILLSKILFYRNKLNYSDLIVGIFFLTFLLINKNPWLRIYVPITYFLLFYLLNEIQSQISKVNYNKFKINEISTIILIFFIIFISPNKDYEETTKSQIINIEQYKNNCEVANNYLSQLEIWIFINIYPNYCEYKYDPNSRKNILFDK
jgi:hypothetical protein